MPRSHHLVEDDIKVISIKKQNVDYREEESVKTIKIIRGIPSDVERGPVLCDICSESMKTQAYLDRHMKVMHSGMVTPWDCSWTRVSRPAMGKLDMERTHNYVCKRKTIGKEKARRSLGSMRLWNFKNLNLMKVKATRKTKRYF